MVTPLGPVTLVADNVCMWRSLFSLVRMSLPISLTLLLEHQMPSSCTLTFSPCSWLVHISSCTFSTTFFSSLHSLLIISNFPFIVMIYSTTAACPSQSFTWCSCCAIFATTTPTLNSNKRWNSFIKWQFTGIFRDASWYLLKIMSWLKLFYGKESHLWSPPSLEWWVDHFLYFVNFIIKMSIYLLLPLSPIQHVHPSHYAFEYAQMTSKGYGKWKQRLWNQLCMWNPYNLKT